MPIDIWGLLSAWSPKISGAQRETEASGFSAQALLVWTMLVNHGEHGEPREQMTQQDLVYQQFQQMDGLEHKGPIDHGDLCSTVSFGSMVHHNNHQKLQK